MSRRRGTAIEAAVEAELAPGSARSFGWLMTVILLVLAGMAYAHDNLLYAPLALGAGVFALLALLAPRVLGPLNRAWLALGLLLGRLITPVIMGLIYFGLVTPLAVLARWRGVDPMRRRWDAAAPSYWIRRDPPGPDPATMERQH